MKKRLIKIYILYIVLSTVVTYFVSYFNIFDYGTLNQQGFDSNQHQKEIHLKNFITVEFPNVKN